MQTSLREHYRATVLLGVPLICSQVAQIVLGFVDSIMIGQHSTIELSAASFCINLFNLPIVVALGYSYGLTPLIGQSYGRGELMHAGAWLRRGVRANMLFGVFLALVMCVPLLYLAHLGLPSTVIPYVKPYYFMQLLSLPFIGLFNAFKQFSDAINRTAISMWIMLGGNLLNVLGNWILIYGALGAPELGLLGAGLSTLVSRVLMALTFAIITLRRSHNLRYRVGYWRHECIGLPPSRLMHRSGFFVALQMGLETAMFSLSIIMIGWLGECALAAHHVAVTVQTLGFMMYYGAGAAICVRVSQYWGRGEIKQVRLAVKSGVHLVLVLAIVLMLLLIGLRTPLSQLFTDDPEVVNLAIIILLVGIAYQPADALQVTYANALRGTGEGLSLSLIAFIGYFVIALPLAYVFGFVLQGGVLGVWLAFPIGLGLAAVGYGLRFRWVIKEHEYKGAVVR